MSDRIRSAVRFPWGRRFLMATLADRGWSVPDLPALAKTLDLSASPRDLSPAAGDPFVHAAEAAARLLGGEARFAPVPDHPDRLY